MAAKQTGDPFPVKAVILSLIIGAVLTVAYGFWFGGWHSMSAVQAELQDQEEDLSKLWAGPLCVSNFRLSEDKMSDIEKIEKYRSYSSGRDLKNKASSSELSWANLPGKNKVHNDAFSDCVKKVLEMKSDVAAMQPVSEG